MNSSDDPIDKSLRDHFQQAFDNFEVQPAASLKTRIRQRMNVPARKRRPYGALVLGMLLLIGTGLYIRSYQALVRSYETKVSQAAIAEPNGHDQSDKAGKEPGPGSSYSHRFTSEIHSPSRRVVQPTADVADKEDHIPADRPDQLTNIVAAKPVFAPLKVWGVKRQLGNNQHSIRSNRASPKTVTEFTDVGNQTDKQTTRFIALRSETSEISLTKTYNSPEKATVPVESEAVSWESLRSLALRPIGGIGTQISRNVQVAALTSAPAEQPKNPRTPVRWLVGVAPLSTYQLMTVVAKPDAYVQRVDAPSPFAGPTWGYQLSGGVEWRKYDFQVSFGQIRRWAYYDLATDVFQIRPVGSNKYQITSLEQPVAENVSLTMLGASINRQYRLGGVNSRYVARLGGQTSYVPASNQTLIWAKAALGLTLPFQTVYQLQFGPTVEYGFSRLWSNERQLIIHPYLVGAAITIRPTKP